LEYGEFSKNKFQNKLFAQEIILLGAPNITIFHYAKNTKFGIEKQNKKSNFCSQTFNTYDNGNN
jgi:hypothetical protein